VNEPSISRDHPAETRNQVAAIASNITRGRDVLAALAAAWSSSLDLAAADDQPLHAPTVPRTDRQQTTSVAQ
jgi:hypothetical protein